MKPKLRYFNSKQLLSMMVSAKNEYIIASRGFGKSEGIDAPRLLRNVFAMPRSTGALLSPTYGKLLRNTLPAVFHALSRLGYHRDIHYFVGKKPPAKLNFNSPYIQSFNYDYVITWFNGSVQNLISFDRPMSANSMSLDYIMGFEAKYLNYDKIKTEVLPANRGNTNYFSQCPWHHGVLFTSDMPTSKSGQWILDKEHDMDSDLIKLILLTYQRYKKTTSVKLRMQFYRELCDYRREASYFAEYDAFDNIEILGEGFIRDMERQLPPLLFATSILNKRIRKIANGFYAAFSEDIHSYQAYNNTYLDSLDYNLDDASRELCLKDGDLLVDKPLCIALDYNAAINNLVVGQLTEKRECRTLKSFFVKTPRKIKDVTNDFCDYYHHMPHRDVIYFFDSTAVADTPSEGESFADTVLNTLQHRGWNVSAIHIGQPLRHSIKHNYIDLGLKGDPSYLFPTFNADNCEYLILALESTGIIIGKRGFEKDKNPEKLPDSAEQPDEMKTHVTDAWDTLYLGINFHYPTMISTSLITHFSQP